MRYKIYDGSQSAHCCFEATVVDMSKPKILGGEHYRDSKTGQRQYEAVCECFEISDAEMIQDALNSAEKNGNRDSFGQNLEAKNVDNDKSKEQWLVKDSAGEYIAVTAETWECGEGLKFKIDDEVVAWFVSWQHFRKIA